MEVKVIKPTGEECAEACAEACTEACADQSSEHVTITHANAQQIHPSFKKNSTERLESGFTNSTRELGVDFVGVVVHLSVFA